MRGTGADPGETRDWEALAYQPFDPESYPEVLAALRVRTEHPSSDAIAVISSCHGAGLTLRHARWALAQRELGRHVGNGGQ
jgi:hypothetical protein